MGGDEDDVARRAYLGITRGTLVKSDESKKLAEVTVRDRFGELRTNVEHWSPFGFTNVPLPPTGGKEAEVVVAYLGGDPSHPIVLSVTDRRHRPKNLKPGESARFDDQKQVSKLGRDGIETTGKKVTITGGGDQPKGDTKDFELNEQLKGLAAQVLQIKDSHHALFDVVSKLRENVESVVVGLAPINVATQVTSALNGLPAGLDAMKALAEGKLQGFVQNAAKDALKSFLDPSRLLNVTSVLSGGIEAAISSLKAQIADLVANNPVVAAVDDLKDELSALTSSDCLPSAIASKTAELAGQITALTAANPIIGTVARLRNTLQGLIDTAGPGLNFLEPQKRLVQGLTRSMRFGGPG